MALQLAALPQVPGLKRACFRADLKALVREASVLLSTLLTSEETPVSQASFLHRRGVSTNSAPFLIGGYTQQAVHQPIADAVGLLAMPAGRHKGQRKPASALPRSIFGSTVRLGFGAAWLRDSCAG